MVFPQDTDHVRHGGTGGDHPFGFGAYPGKGCEWQTKKAPEAGKDQVFEPLYTTEDVKACLPSFDQNGYDSLHQLPGGMRFRFVDAGHILGSASLELWFRDGGRDKKIVFSGDVGKNGNPIIRDPEHITEADYVVVESTYGNRFHKDLEASIEELEKAVRETFRREGTSFSRLSRSAGPRMFSISSTGW
jgi:metallo-beta-lactamase family protein